MESSLPLSKLNRDELYTFIGGLFVSQVWFLYLLSNGMVELNESLYITLSIVLWICSTAMVFLLNVILYLVTNKFQSDITTEDYEKIDKVQHAVNVTEGRIFIHIYSVIFSSLVLVAIPTFNYLCRGELPYYWGILIVFLVAVILSLVFYLYNSRKYNIFYKCVKDGKCTYIEQ